MKTGENITRHIPFIGVDNKNQRDILSQFAGDVAILIWDFVQERLPR